MQRLTAFLAALALGAAASAGAQTVIQATPDTPPPSGGDTVVVVPPPSGGDTLLVVPPTATPVPDPAADAKCRAAMPSNYWDCMNSHNGGQ